MVLQDLEHNQGVCGAMVLHHIYVGVQAKHLLEACSEALLVQPVGFLADGVDEGAVHICMYAASIRRVVTANKGGEGLLLCEMDVHGTDCCKDASAVAALLAWQSPSHVLQRGQQEAHRDSPKLTNVTGCASVTEASLTVILLQGAPPPRGFACAV